MPLECIKQFGSVHQPKAGSSSTPGIHLGSYRFAGHLGTQEPASDLGPVKAPSGSMPALDWRSDRVRSTAGAPGSFC